MPATKTVCLTEASHQALSRMAEEEGRTLGEELGRLIEEKRRKRFFEQANAEYERMSSAEAESYRSEMRSLEGTLMDGLEDESWSEDAQSAR